MARDVESHWQHLEFIYYQGCSNDDFSLTVSDLLTKVSEF